MKATDDESPGRALLVALGAMAGVALLAGVAIGLVVMAVIHFAGVGGSEPDAQQAPESLFIPDYSPTGGLEDSLGLPTLSPTPSTPDGPDTEVTPKARPITLFVAPQSVSTGERINFNGVYQEGEGVALQVQRKVGGSWIDFPVTATVRGGSFSTWIQTSQSGRSPFRVYDEGAARASNTVVVTID